MVCEPLIIKGDMVLVKRDESKKKNYMPYNTTPSTEFDMKGSIVIAEAQNGSSVTRSTSFFKTVQIGAGFTDAVGPLQSNDTQTRRCPKRIHTRPVKSDDYLCY